MAKEGKIQNILVNKSKELYTKLSESDYHTLTKPEILKILGEDYTSYYSYIVSALAFIGKITKRSGRTGGIELYSGKGVQKQLVKDNIKKLTSYFGRADLGLEVKESKKEQIKESKKEKELYAPLEDYLKESGMFDLVEVKAESREGGKWENVDIICVKFNKLIYHLGIYPKLTGIEVKREFPNIKHIQQTASYLRYCHSAYLCFHDSQYRGKDVDVLLTKLRDEEIWDLSNVFNIGLIVAYKAQVKSDKFRFQLIKEAPDTSLDPTSVEEGIKILLSNEAKAELSKALKDQLKLITFADNK